MEQSTALKAVRAITGIEAAEAAPTTSSAWVGLNDVGGTHFGRARAVFGAPTLGDADNTGEVTIWAREGSVIVPVGSTDIEAGKMDPVELGVCPPSWTFFATVTSISGTEQEIAVTVYVHRYTDYK